MVTVAEIMRRDRIVSSTPEATLREASRIMSRERVGSVMVITGASRLVGIFTERDLVRALASGANPDTARIEEYMTRNPITASPGESAVMAAHKMLEHGIRHLPVVDSTGKLIGVVSMRDVLRRILSEADFP